eukprot:TRINITY_DN82819_c0_g1_i1.p2 TRINITY_DN82819_c0_g1~~TRINITY_DN82819_c0_g1_i1.p2  ORF type:complete len:255 (-),score=75.52 TRINITY_DN82819_c0_g1_i1:133-897(-)
MLAFAAVDAPPPPAALRLSTAAALSTAAPNAAVGMRPAEGGRLRGLAPRRPRRAVPMEAVGGAAGGVPQVTLFTKPGCTLCEKALDVLESAAEDAGQKFELRTVNIDAEGNEEWRARYWMDIPVFHINDEFWAKHRLTAKAVSKGLDAGADGSFSAQPGEPDSRLLDNPADRDDDCTCDNCLDGKDCCGEGEAALAGSASASASASLPGMRASGGSSAHGWSVPAAGLALACGAALLRRSTLRRRQGARRGRST